MKYLACFFTATILLLSSCDPLEEPCDFKLCSNGGVCIDGNCECAEGFSGPNCENDLCIGITCQNDGVCIDGACKCPDGFSGTNCETAADPCTAISCQNDGICENGNCNCPEGFTGVNCENMIDPCTSISCENEGTCIDGVCDCPDGYTGVNCELVDPCISISCENDGICEDGACNCPPDYAGTTCEIYTPNLFQGFWSAEDNCGSQMINYVTSLSFDQNNNTIFEVGEFGEFGSTRKFEAVIDGFKITIERIEVENNLFLSATGTISPGGEQIDWMYTIDDSGTVVSCTGVWMKI